MRIPSAQPDEQPRDRRLDPSQTQDCATSKRFGAGSGSSGYYGMDGKTRSSKPSHPVGKSGLSRNLGGRAPIGVCRAIDCSLIRVLALDAQLLRHFICIAQCLVRATQGIQNLIAFR